MVRSQAPPPRTPRFLMLASISVTVAALYFAQDVLIPLALAVLLTFLLTPLVIRLERLRVGRVPSVIIVVIFALGILLGIGYAVFVQLEQLATDLPTYQTNIVSKAGRVLPHRGGVFEKLVKTVDEVSTKVVGATTQPDETTQPTTAPATQRSTIAVSDSRAEKGTSGTPSNKTSAAPSPPGTKENPTWVHPIDSPTSPLRGLFSTLATFLSPLGTAGMVLVFTVFMMLSREDLRDRLIRLVGQGKLTVTTQALNDAGQRISRYLLMQSIVNGTYGVAISLGLWIIGVPNPILFGLLCALLRFIPYIGPWIGAAFPLVVALGKFPGSRELLETLGLFVVIELVSNNVMEPWLYGASTGISTVAVLVAAVFWTWLWGPVGLLLSTPLTVVLVVIGKYVPQLAFLDIMLGDEPVLEPYERVYQRLLALDQEEATELVREYRKSMSLERVYDEVLLPALALAEQDRVGGMVDEAQEKYIHQALRDIIDELGEAEHAETVRQAAVDTVQAAKEAIAKSPVVTAYPSADVDEVVRMTLPKGCVVTVICLPAHDEADEIVNLMLAQLLNHTNHCAISVSVTALASEMLEQIESKKADAVVVSALPPSAVSHARYLCKRIHNRFAEIPMIVGLWTYKGDVDKAKSRIACEGSVALTTTLKQTLDEIQQVVQPLVESRSTDSPPSAG